jgi:3-deoxy-manno-octulosonate cytidylyltransferase (CMP-KDO synthetase)
VNSGSADAPFSGEAVGIIPARCASSRFPDKPLARIAGVPMICWTLKNASKAAGLREVFVAAEDEDIVRAVRDCGGEAMLVRGAFRSGSDRVAAAAKELDTEAVVNIQGDEPLISPSAIDDALRLLEKRPEFGITTIAQPFKETQGILDPNQVKVIVDRKQRCLYFSRAPIPHRHRSSAFSRAIEGGPFLHHIGIYCFRKSTLMEFSRLPESSLEEIEGLEQLRYLEYGGSIGAVVIVETGPSINTANDLRTAEAFIAEHNIKFA